MTPVILVPRRDGDPVRDETWAWVKAWWAERFPDWPIVEGHHDEGLFNRSAAVNRAARAAGPWEVAVIIDSDIVIDDPGRVRTAVEMASSSGRMTLPFDVRRDLNQRGSDALMRGRTRGLTRGLDRWVRREYRDGLSNVVVVPRSLWETVEGFDEQFVGWGFEDNAFAVACQTFGGSIDRLPGDVFHLWHDGAVESRRGEPVNARNRARGARYHAAMGDVEAVRAVRADGLSYAAAGAGIPRVLHRTVPRETSDEVERWWAGWQALHPGWVSRTWRDPLDPAAFPITSPWWDLVAHGAQLADLVRLEVLWREGGIYLDSDMEPYRPLDPLLPLSAFAAWEDKKRVPNAVIGAVPGHPAIRECLDLAIARLRGGERDITVATGPGVLTDVLPHRTDVLLLPPGTFYPFHYREAKRARARDHSEEQPWAFGAHHWAGSWLPEGKRW